MIDPFKPLMITEEALKLKVDDYYKSWMDVHKVNDIALSVAALETLDKEEGSISLNVVVLHITSFAIFYG